MAAQQQPPRTPRDLQFERFLDALRETGNDGILENFQTAFREVALRTAPHPGGKRAYPQQLLRDRS